MFSGLGLWEILVVFVVVLLVVGPKRLPEVAKTIGKSLAEFRRAAAEMRTALEAEVEEVEKLDDEVSRIEMMPQSSETSVARGELLSETPVPDPHQPEADESRSTDSSPASTSHSE